MGLQLDIDRLAGLVNGATYYFQWPLIPLM
jgi:hypothetical protein